MLRLVTLCCFMLAVRGLAADYKQDAPPPPLENRVADLERRVRLLEGQIYALTDPKLRPVTAKEEQKQQTQSTVTVPPGYHAHRTTDGRVIVHGNENLGNADAHEGVAHPWIRIAEGGQTVQTQQTYSYQSYSSTSCPNGVCPTQRRGLIGRIFGR